ncbi:MAG: PIN domain-containing protein [Blautia sp.]|nr:PIN domain-containing protein [Blautia sp.]
MQWSKNMQLIDANVILRCILDDYPEMTEQAIKVINNGAYTKPEIIAEVVYVLQKVYSVQRQQIKAMLNQILDLVFCSEEKSVRYALNLYADVALDFVDCLLVAYNKINKEKVFSFDKKLNKYIGAFF